MQAITEIEDLRRLARARVPRMFYDYADSGSYTESTYRSNESAFERVRLRQRVAVDISQRSTRTRMLGEDVVMPVALAPTGLTGMQHADGEILAACAARDFGVPFTLSTMSICSIEDVAAATQAPFWFQLYVMRQRDFMDRLIGRAQQAGCSALMLTLDLQVIGQRHKDIRNGMSAPPRFTPATVLDLMRHPRWCLGMLGTRRRQFGNLIGHIGGVDNLGSLSAWIQQQFDPALNWNDVEYVKRRWGGKLIVKGVMEPEDARRAVECGADAVIVSNHGGRQLDGAPSSLEALPAVAAEVASRTELWVDGGIRSGQSVLKALALGARGTLIGRPFLYGLGAMGQPGVRRCLEIIQKELDTTLGFCGCTRVEQLGRQVIYDGAPGVVARQ
jgi:L-lactate dehydrogenase (cytochrome)